MLVPALLVLALVLVMLGCAQTDHDLELAQRDRASFDSTVWPILVRDCGFSECHGSAERFFRVLGPGHVRLDPAMRLTEPATEAELAFSYERARSMIDADDPARSLLLLKPLEVEAGGSSHDGVDRFGLDVYRSKADPRFQTLAAWALATPVAAPAP
jgi:hypothetical protein